MEKRDTQFFSELKTMNEDLLSYLKELQDKSPYYDFSPTLEDYVRQFKELDKKYPEKTTFPSVVNSLPTLTTIANTTNTNLINTNPINTNPINTNTINTSLNTITTTTMPAPAPTPAPLFSFSNTATPTAPAALPSFTFGGSTNNNAPFFSFSNVFSNQKANETTTTQPRSDDASDDDAPPPEPNVEKYDEPDSKYSVKCKLYEKGRTEDGEITMSLLGLGQLFIKSMDDPNKRQVIFRQDPDLRRVLVNEVLTPSLPVKPLPKAVQMVFPTASGGTKFYIAKLKDEATAGNLVENLKF